MTLSAVTSHPNHPSQLTPDEYRAIPDPIVAELIEYRAAASRRPGLVRSVHAGLCADPLLSEFHPLQMWDVADRICGQVTDVEAQRAK